MRSSYSHILVASLLLFALFGCSDDSVQQDGTFLQFEGDVVNVSLFTFCTVDDIRQDTFEELPQTFDLECTPEAVQVTGTGTDLGMRLLIDGEPVAEDRQTIEDAEEDDSAFLEVFLVAPDVSSQDAATMEARTDGS